MTKFINDLIAVNPNAAREKRDCWLIIAKAYVEANPGQTRKQILAGLNLGEGSAASGSCYHALRRLIFAGKLTRTEGLPQKYWPAETQKPTTASGSNVTICGTLLKNWNTVTPYTRS